MSKVITFSRVFPTYHPKRGQPTYFVEKIWKSLWDQNKAHDIHLYQEPYDEHFHPMGKDSKNIHQFNPKHHTIRAGHRWEVGEKFSPRVWAGKPYNSKQIVIAPDIEIVKIYDFKVTPSLYYLDNNSYDINDLELLYKISNNDGLTLNELRAWFKFPCDFEGQIICWGEVNYG